MHVDEIAKLNGQDPKKLGAATPHLLYVERFISTILGRFLRFLATNHVYRELKPNVFTNTRISSMLDTLKPSKEIIAEYNSFFHF